MKKPENPMLPRTKTNNLLFALYGVAPPPPSRAASFILFSPSRLSIDSNDLDSIDAPSKNELERRENALNVGGGGK
jgi:hypothetical protein